MAQGVVMCLDELRRAVTSTVGDDFRFTTSTVGEGRGAMVVVDFSGLRVATFSPDGLFRVVLGNYETLFHAYDEEDQEETVSRAIDLILRWVRGELEIKERRNWRGQIRWFVDMGDFEQQVRRYSV